MKKLSLIFILLFFTLLLFSCEQECRHDNMSESTVEPTCTENGQTTYTCLDCGYTYLDKIIEPVGHIFNDNIIVADCTNDGYTEYTCHCGYSYISDIVSAAGHDYADDVKDADCVNGGYTTHTCKSCNYSYISNHTDPKGHTFTEETVSVVSCTETGEVKYTCACGETYTKLSPPTGHSFSKLVTMPTLSDMGYTEFSCDNCEFEYVGDYRFYSDILKDAYAEGGEVLARGIDLSYHNYETDGQGNYIPLDWEQIKASGVDYVILRAGYSSQTDGSFHKDEAFELSYKGAKEAGLDVGVYFYTCARSVDDIRIEANLLIEILNGKQFEYPIYLDLEDEITYLNPDKTALLGFDAATLNQMCVEFFSTLQRAGYYTGLYVSSNWLYTFLDTDDAISRFDIWLAKWNIEEAEPLWNKDEDGQPFGMWQYSETGSIDGVNKAVDLNFAYKDYPTIIKEGGFNGYRNDIRFPDTQKTFVTAVSGLVNIRSEWNVDDSSNILGQIKRGEKLEVIEINEECAVVYYKGRIAYISKNPAYVSFIDII